VQSVTAYEPAEQLLPRRLPIDAATARLAALRAEMVTDDRRLPAADCAPPTIRTARSRSSGG